MWPCLCALSVPVCMQFGQRYVEEQDDKTVTEWMRKQVLDPPFSPVEPVPGAHCTSASSCLLPQLPCPPLCVHSHCCWYMQCTQQSSFYGKQGYDACLFTRSLTEAANLPS